MPYLEPKEIEKLGFKHVGKNVTISSLAAIYNHDQISIDDNSRIDDFCVISGKVSIGKHVHIAAQCLLAGGSLGIVFEDFSGAAYQVKVFTQSDDYLGYSMTNPTIPGKYKQETKSAVNIGRHSIIGAGSIILPGANLAIGTSVGAMSVISKPTKPWGVYVGIRAKRVKERKQDLLLLEKQFLAEHNQ